HKKDIQNFLKKNKSGKVPDPLVEYEPYTSENGISVSDNTRNTIEGDSKTRKSSMTFKKKKKRKNTVKSMDVPAVEDRKTSEVSAGIKSQVSEESEKTGKEKSSKSKKSKQKAKS